MNFTVITWQVKQVVVLIVSLVGKKEHRRKIEGRVHADSPIGREAAAGEAG